MPKLDDQISTLQQRLQQLKLRQQRLEARRRATAEFKERKADTRRKILLGGIILEKLRQGELDRQVISDWLERGLTRAQDRALFDLPPMAGHAADDAASAHRLAGETEPPPGIEGNDGHRIG
jgi:large subunit ribosomal protein L7/L12